MIHCIALFSQKFLCQTSDVPGIDRGKLKAEVLAVIFKDNLSGIYEHMCSELGWDLDAGKLAAMKAANQAKLTQLEESIADATENLGQMEVRNAMQAKADYLGHIGDAPAAAQAYSETEQKTASVGHKVDLVFSQIRLYILYSDWNTVKAHLARAQTLCDAGGDWEHKNKLKVYKALFAMHSRDLKGGAALLLDSIATFTTSELFSYATCIFYAGQSYLFFSIVLLS